MLSIKLHLLKYLCVLMTIATLFISTGVEYCYGGHNGSKIKVEIAGEKYPLIFEKCISSHHKQYIAKDIEKALAPVKKATFKQKDEPVALKLPDENKPISFNYALLPKDPRQKSIQGNGILPSLLKMHFEAATKVEDEYYLLVDAELIEEYQRVMELKDKSPKMFSKVKQFIKMLNNRDKVDSLVQNSDLCEKHVYTGSGVTINYAMKFIREHLSDAHVSSPSVLDIKPLSTVKHSYLPDSGYVMTVVIEKSQQKGAAKEFLRVQLGLYTEATPRWRIIIYPMP